MDQTERLAILNDCLDVESWASICLTAIERAENGDGWARDWITEQLRLQVDVDGPGLGGFDELLTRLDMANSDDRRRDFEKRVSALEVETLGRRA